MSEITLLTGGSRSGKSSYALELAQKYEKKGFIATAEAYDDEMKGRIANHRKERGESFIKVEEPRYISEAIAKLAESVDCIVIDCMTVWLSNLMFIYGMEKDTFPEIEKLIETLGVPPCPLFIVTNEVGNGIVPENALARRFRDLAGNLNRRIAQISDNVVLMTCGLPFYLKEEKIGFLSTQKAHIRNFIFI
jgi:adenosylcobinamide kinase/adenosylcobinamide-phosphate guanylyltransferase